jgi:hypothetical protein
MDQNVNKDVENEKQSGTTKCTGYCDWNENQKTEIAGAHHQNGRYC